MKTSLKSMLMATTYDVSSQRINDTRHTYKTRYARTWATSLVCVSLPADIDDVPPHLGDIIAFLDKVVHKVADTPSLSSTVHAEDQDTVEKILKAFDLNAESVQTSTFATPC